MVLTPLDWTILAAYFAASLAIGLYFTRRAGSSSSEFFTAKGSVGWFLAGTSMVATTFAADTPLAVAGFVAKNGIAMNWLWWNMIFGGMLTVFFYARLWKRAGVQTDVEFSELRYAGRPAAFLRGFRAIYLAVAFNCVVMGWVNKAMVDILTVCFSPEEAGAGIAQMTQLRYVLICFGLVGAYSLLSGLWGVLFTDAFQFILAMAGCIVMAFVVVDKAGGLAGIEAGVVQAYGPARLEDTLRILPAADSSWMPWWCFLVFLAVPWWSAWYPGSEPGGGAFVAQRMLSAKDERNSFFATLWFYIAHFALRPWPWIFAGLAGMVLYPEVVRAGKGELTFPMMVRDHLPSGLRGLLLTAFLAAYMSTIATLLNWGASYLVNDVYRRFIRRDAPDAHYVAIGRTATVILLILGGAVTFALDSVAGAWKFVIVATAGTGTVYLLRWYWWRINAWSEIAAMIAALAGAACAGLFTTLDPDTATDFAKLLVLVTAVTTVVWLAATYLTAPEPREVLERFYRKIRPAGPGWGPVAAACPDVKPDPGFGLLWVQWALACVLILGALFGVGEALLGRHASAGPCLAAAIVAGGVLWRMLGRGTRGQTDR